MDAVNWDLACFFISTSSIGVQITPIHLTASKPKQDKKSSASGEFPNAQMTADLKGNCF